MCSNFAIIEVIMVRKKTPGTVKHKDKTNTSTSSQVKQIEPLDS